MMPANISRRWHSVRAREFVPKLFRPVASHDPTGEGSLLGNLYSKTRFWQKCSLAMGRESAVRFRVWTIPWQLVSNGSFFNIGKRQHGKATVKRCLLLLRGGEMQNVYGHGRICLPFETCLRVTAIPKARAPRFCQRPKPSCSNHSYYVKPPPSSTTVHYQPASPHRCRSMNDNMFPVPQTTRACETSCFIPSF